MATPCTLSEETLLFMAQIPSRLPEAARLTEAKRPLVPLHPSVLRSMRAPSGLVQALAIADKSL